MSRAVANRARRACLNIASETTSLLEPFLLAQGSELVSESNLIEGYQVSPRQVQDAVITYGELLDGPVHALLEVLRADEKIVTALGVETTSDPGDSTPTSPPPGPPPPVRTTTVRRTARRSASGKRSSWSAERFSVGWTPSAEPTCTWLPRGVVRPRPAVGSAAVVGREAVGWRMEGCCWRSPR